jgi:DNA-3-methyladenine glycosylase I
MSDVSRCHWVTPAMVEYHDTIWGRPSRDNTLLFEMLALSGQQAGLSWSTVLNKRAAYKRAFANWNVHDIASFDESKVQELVQDQSIIRNQQKIRSVIANAQATGTLAHDE